MKCVFASMAIEFDILDICWSGKLNLVSDQFNLYLSELKFIPNEKKTTLIGCWKARFVQLTLTNVLYSCQVYCMSDGLSNFARVLFE